MAAISSTSSFALGSNTVGDQSALTVKKLKNICCANLALAKLVEIVKQGVIAKAQKLKFPSSQPLAGVFN